MVVGRRTAAPVAGRAQTAVPRMNRQRVVDKAKESAKDNRSGGTYNLPYDFFKPAKGTKVVRILPYVVTDANHPERVPAGEIWWRRPLKVHFNVGPEEKAYLCPTMVGERCPICEYALERKRSGEADKEELGQLKAKDRDLFLVQDPENPDTIMSWEVSFHNFTKQLVREIDDRPDEYAGFADLIDGLDLRIRFAEASMGTNKFLEADRIDFITRKKQPDPAILQQIPSLDDAMVILPYAELEAIFMGTAVPASEEGQQEDVPPPADEDIPPEEQEEVVEEEPQPEPEPAPKPAPPARRTAPPAPAAARSPPTHGARCDGR